MRKSGILVHVHHLETAGWEDLLCGDPDNDKFGSLAMVVYLILTAPADAPISTIVIGCGPSSRDGLSEGEYSKQAMVRYFDRLQDFPRLQPLLQALAPVQLADLRSQIEGILVTPELIRTADEVRIGAEIFTEHGVNTVYEVCAASHAPRCVQQQANARAQGVIPPSQLWLVAATDMCFIGAVPDDTVILEPAHKGGDPVLHSTYTLPKALKPVIRMDVEHKEALAKIITDYVIENTPLAKEDLPAPQQVAVP